MKKATNVFNGIICKNNNMNNSFVVLRHDVDRKPKNSLNMARIEHNFNATGSYYFRMTENSYNLNIMEKISHLNHEIGYHYEDLDNAIKFFKEKSIKHFSNDDLLDKAFNMFERNLATLRVNFDIKTITMHGSPLSRYDNKMLWRKYDYKKLGIICEPYLDIDYSSISYLTDTGRNWGNSVSIRDFVDSSYSYDFNSTNDIIKNVSSLADKVIFTIHPERWTNEPIEWVNSLITQKLKNIIKSLLLKTNYYKNHA